MPRPPWNTEKINHQADRHNHVTAVITHHIRVGRERGYETWITGISAAARTFPGHLGVSILRPQPGPSLHYIIVLRFDTIDHLTGWLESETRRDWIDRATPLIEIQEPIQILTGLEAWFALPTQRLQPTPKRYKQVILVWVGVMLVSVLIMPLIAPFLTPLPALLRTAINAGVTVTVLLYGIVPRLTQWFRGWLSR